MKKFSFVAFVITGILFFSCGKGKNSEMNFAVLKGPSALSFCGAMSDEFLEKMPCTVNFEIFASPDFALPMVVKGEMSGCVLPADFADKFNEKNPDVIQIAAVCAEGCFSFISTNPEYKDFDSLVNKTVYVPRGSTMPEYIFNYASCNSSLQKVSFDKTLSPPEIVSALASGKIDNGILPEPFITLAFAKCGQSSVLKNPLKLSINLTECYSQISGKKNYPMSVIVFNKNYYEENRKVINKFLQVFEESVKWTLANPAEASCVAEKKEIGLQASLIEKSILKAEICCKPVEQFNMAECFSK